MCEVFKNYYDNLCRGSSCGKENSVCGEVQRCYFLFEDKDFCEKNDDRFFAIHNMDTGCMVGSIRAVHVKKGMFAAINMMPLVTQNFEKKGGMRILRLLKLGKILWPFSWSLSNFLAKRFG